MPSIRPVFPLSHKRLRILKSVLDLAVDEDFWLGKYDTNYGELVTWDDPRLRRHMLKRIRKER